MRCEVLQRGIASCWSHVSCLGVCKRESERGAGGGGRGGVFGDKKAASETLTTESQSAVVRYRPGQNSKLGRKL